MSSYCSYAQWVPGTGTIYPATITDKVGIGTTSPGVTLTTRSGINALPVTSGITQPGGALRVEGGDNAVVDFGTYSTNTWIQATDKTSLDVNYNLNLNPNGGKVGIGTASPTNHLQIGSVGSTGYAGNAIAIGDGTNVVALHYGPTGYLVANGNLALGGNTNANQLFLAGGGNVGIGTTTPTAKLYVAAGGRNGLKIDDSLDGTPASKYLSFWQGTGAAVIDPIGTCVIYLGYDQSSDVMFGGSSSNGVWKASGNVIIGQTTQINSAYKLDVYGKARANEIVVNSSGADFVFDKKYALPKLSDVKAYINKNQHLPEIPSAKEMQTNGMSVGEINTKLLQKVEELTLYTIEKDKQIIEEKQTNNQQQKELKKQEARIAALEKALLKLTENQSK